MSLLCLAGPAWVTWQLYYDWSSAHWPTTQGVVRQCNVAVSTTFDDDGNEEYAADFQIVYDYQVEGREFQGERYAFGALKNSNPSAFKDQASILEGDQMTVYVHPDNPRRAVLQPRSSRPLDTLFSLLFALFCPLFVLGFFASVGLVKWK